MHWTHQNQISIHLMLMLIVPHFCLYAICLHFNTSHVNVNPDNHVTASWQNQISIHLMLMLIIIILLIILVLVNFNTSHVNVNPRYNIFSPRRGTYFNTSHVNVNLCSEDINLWFSRISIHLMLMLISFLFQERLLYNSISIHLMLMLIL